MSNAKILYLKVYTNFADKILTLLSSKYVNQKSVKTYLYMFLYFSLGLRRNVSSLTLSQFDSKLNRFYPRPYAIYNGSPLYMVVPKHLINMLLVYSKRFKVELDEPLFNDIERPTIYEKKIYELTNVSPQELVNIGAMIMIEYSRNPKEIARLLFLNRTYLGYLVNKMGMKLSNDFKLITPEGKILEPVEGEILHPFLYLKKYILVKSENRTERNAKPRPFQGSEVTK